MREFFECPECGTEILEAEYCASCDGKGIVNSNIWMILETCEDCNGTGKSKNYYCPHCSWQHEE